MIINPSTPPLVGSKVNLQHPLARGLVGYWPLNEGAGAGVNDASAQSLKGLMAGTIPANAWIGSPLGTAANFTGANYITSDTNWNIAHFSGPNTIAIRVMFNSYPTSGNLMSLAGTKYQSSAGKDVQLVDIHNNAGTLLLRFFSGVFSGTTATTTWTFTTTTMPLNVWHTIICVADGTNRIIYVNGEAKTTSASAVVAVATSGTKWVIGAIDIDAAISRYVNGSINHVGYWKRALTQIEVKQLTSNPNQLFRKQPIWVVPQIAFDAASNSGYKAAESSYSWNHTCTGNDRYLTVGISMLSLAQTVSGITYNGVAMTLLGVQSSITGAARVELWGLVAPATGSNSIAVTLTDSIASAGNASSYVNVHQSDSTESFKSAQATNVGPADAEVDITPIADGCMLLNIVCTDDTVILSGETETGNVSGAGGSGGMAYYYQTTAGPYSLRWQAVDALMTWAIGGIALRPITASSNVTTTQTISGVVRIQIATTQTIGGVVRVQVATTQTITGVVRIQIPTTQTIGGVVRIQVATTQTISGVFAISGAVTRTIAGIVRIQVATTQTISGNVWIRGINSIGLILRKEKEESITAENNDYNFNLLQQFSNEAKVEIAQRLDKAANLSDVANAATSFNNIKQSASNIYEGSIRLADSTEADAGSSTTLVMSPYEVNSLYRRIGWHYTAKWAGLSTTTITTQNVYVLMALGTGTLFDRYPNSDASWVLGTSRITYKGTATKKFKVFFTFAVTDIITVGDGARAIYAIYKNGTIDGHAVVRSRTLYQQSGDQGVFSLMGLFSLATNDYIEFFIANNDNTNDFQVDSGQVIIEELL